MGRLLKIRGWGVAQWSGVAGIIGSLAAVAALFFPGGDDGGASPSNPTSAAAKEAARQALQNFYGARWGTLWQGLHSVDKALVSREKYVDCQISTGAPAQLLSLKLNDPVPYDARVRPEIPAEDVRVVDSVERTIEGHKGELHRVVNSTSVLVAKDDDDWKVLLFPHEYRAYRQGRCPPGPTPSEG